MGRPPTIIRWLQALHRESDLSLPCRAVVAAMATRADNEDLSFFQTYGELSAWTGKDERTVRRNVRQAIDSGWLVLESSGNSTRANTYRLAFGRRLNENNEHQVPEVDMVDKNVLVSGQECPGNPDKNVHPTSPETSPETSPKRLEIRSAEADPSPISAPPGPGLPRSGVEDTYDERFRRPPAPLPDGWHMNGLHAELGTALRLPPVKPIAEVFATWAVAEGERSSDWDKKFSALLHAIAECEDWPLDDNGFAEIGSYDMGDALGPLVCGVSL